MMADIAPRAVDKGLEEMIALATGDYPPGHYPPFLFRPVLAYLRPETFREWLRPFNSAFAPLTHNMTRGSEEIDNMFMSAVLDDMCGYRRHWVMEMGDVHIINKPRGAGT